MVATIDRLACERERAVLEALNAVLRSNGHEEVQSLGGDKGSAKGRRRRSRRRRGDTADQGASEAPPDAAEESRRPELVSDGTALPD